MYKEALSKYEEIRTSREIPVDARRVGNGATSMYSYPSQQRTGKIQNCLQLLKVAEVDTSGISACCKQALEEHPSHKPL